MKLVVSGGGTGGHVYPALAVIDALQQAPFSIDKADILYVGTAERAEARLAPQAGLAFYAIAAGAIRGRGPIELIRSTLNVLRGVAEAWVLLQHIKPAAVFVTGGYVCFPVALAAWLRRIPIVLYLPDIDPGLAVRALARLATNIAVSAPPSVAQFPPGSTIVTGYPVRPEFVPTPRDVACSRWGLDPSDSVLLVLGGSLGARSINRRIAESIELLLGRCQVIHICGEQDAAALEARRKELPDLLQLRYLLFPYLHEGVRDAMAAADLAVSRSGASVIGEFTVMGVPSILVPYPHAGDHQLRNAQYLAQNGAAEVLPETSLPDLIPTVLALMRDRDKLTGMAAAARSLARPESARQVAALITRVSGFPKPQTLSPGQV
ncbi:MAG: undecaprenyldiphospho-muramoylpentapeptide beta-N-acetylglucosaminyltransferase [Dehalococcoidia bacterium]|nr:undecaprenyldiphospho-muramoylpentapeptide beta-N-acetylglucosaminyltransferase [Dehalococcoidia bacterium]